jgi:chemotaxis protein MotB
MIRRCSIPFVLVACSVAVSGCGNNDALLAKDAQIAELQGQLTTVRDQATQLEEDYAEALRRAEAFDAELREVAERERLCLERLEAAAVLQLPERLLFGFGNVAITADGTQLLGRLAEVLNRYPDHQIRVIGHTDNLPIKEEAKDRIPSNWELAALRASAVVKYLIYAHEMDPARMQAVSRAEHEPIASNATDDGRAANRRVEIHVAMPRPVRELD